MADAVLLRRRKFGCGSTQLLNQKKRIVSEPIFPARLVDDPAFDHIAGRQHDPARRVDGSFHGIKATIFLTVCQSKDDL